MSPKAKPAKSPSSAEPFQLLFQSHPLPMWVYDLKTLAFLDVNDAMVEKYGYSRAEFLQMTIRDIHPAEELPRLMEDVKKKRPALQHSGEWKHKLRDGRVIDVEITSHTLNYNGRKAALVTAMDITERKQLESKLRASEEIFRLLVENASEVFYQVSLINDPLRGEVIFVSPQAEALTGRRAEEFLHDAELWVKSVHPDDLPRVFDTTQTLLTQRVPVKREYRLWNETRQDYLWVSDHITPRFDTQGQLIGYQGVARDITERKQAEEALRESEAKYRTLIEQIPAIVYVDLLNGKGTTLFISPQVETILGISVEEWMEQDVSLWLNLIHPEDRQKAGEAYAALTTAGQGYEIEYRVVRRDGSMLWIHDTGIVRQGENGQLLLQGVMYDITAQKRAEEQIQLQSAALKAAANTIVITDRQGLIEWTNPSFQALTGYAPAEAVGKSPRDLVKSGKQDEAFYKDLWDTILSGRVWRGELINRRKDGSLYNEEMTITPLRNQQGEISHFIAVKQDITQRKRAEEALRLAEEKYRSIFEGAVEGIFQSTPEGRFLTVNPALARICGYDSPEDMIRSVTDIAHQIYVQPARREEYAREMDAKGEVEKFEYEARRKDGTTVWVSENARAVRDASGVILYYEGNIQDITEKKRASRQRERLLDIINASLNEIYAFDRHTLKFQYVNRGALRNLGYRLEQMQQMTPLDIKPAFNEASFRALIRPLEEGRQSTLNFETVHRRADGSEYPVEVRLQLIGEGDESIFLAVIFDITERKQAEQALRQSETKLQNIIRHSGSMFYTHTPDHVLTYVSPQSRQILACEPEEAMVRWQEFLSDNPLNQVGIEATERAIQTGQRQPPYELELVTRKGRKIWVRVDESPVVEDGKTVAVVGSLTDITERKRHERELEAEAMLAQALGETLELQPLLERLLEAARHAIPSAEKGSLALLSGPEHLQVRAVSGYADSSVLGFTYPVTWGYAGRALRERRPMLIADVQADAELREDARQAQTDEVRALRSAVAVPLLVHETALGVLSLESVRPNAFDEEDLRLLANFAASAALIVERARLFEAGRQKAETIMAVNALGRALASTLDLSAIYRHAIEHLRPLLAFDNFSISLFDETTSALRAAYVYSNGQEMDVSALPPLTIDPDGPHQGRAGAILDTQTVIVNDMGRHAQNRILIGNEQEPQSAVYTPMLVEGKVVGLLELQSYQNHAYRTDDFDLLNTIANQIGMAIQNAALFEKTKKQAEETAALLRISLALSDLNLETTLQTIGERAKSLFNADGCRIFLLEPDGETLRCVLALLENPEAFSDLKIKIGEGVTGSVALSGQAEIVNDMNRDPRAVQVPGTDEEPEAIMFAPLKEQERVVGVISVRRVGHDRPFQSADLELLKAFASLAASAVSNARLFEETRQRAAELETINRISIALRAVSKQEEMLAVVLEETLAALNAEDGLISLLDEPSGLVVKAIARGWPSEFAESPIQAGEGVFGKVFASGNIHVTRDFASDPLTLPESRERLPAGWGGACVPIRTAERALGVMLVAVPSERELGKNEIRLLNTLAEMTGSALHRMRLHEETLRRAEEFESLYKTNAAIASQHNLPALLQTIVNRATSMLNASGGGMYLYDPASGELEAAVSTHPSIPIGLRLKPGEGAAGRVAQTRRPLRLDDYSTWEGRSSQYNGIAVRAVLEAPILFGGELIGVLAVHETGSVERKFTDADERLLSLFAAQAAGAIRSARLREETERRLENLQALREVDRVIASSFDLASILDTVLSHTIAQLNVDAADVMLFRPALQTLEYAAGFGFRTRRVERAQERLGEGWAGMAAMERRMVHIPNLREAASAFPRASLLAGEDFLEYYGVPLISKGEVKGVLEAFHRSPLAPTPEWLGLLETLAGQAAIAVDNVQLFDKLQRSNLELAVAYDATIEGWSRAMDLRDEETQGHTQRVTEKALLLAQAFGISGEELLHLRRGALLHDIGKIGVPDRILLKGAPLTEEEWEIMRKHPLFAYEMLRPISYLRASLDIPYCHHEKWDGTGYPQGLKGEQIPLAARIFAVVDVFDALTSDRPYRPAWTKEKALEYIRQQSGRHFDPQVAEKFLELFGEGNYLPSP